MKRRIIIPLIVLVCVLALFSGSLTRIVGYIQKPLATTGTNIFRWFYFAVADPTMNPDQIVSLINQRDSYALDQVEYERILDENKELRSLLGFADRTALQHVSATIIARSSLDDTGRFLIDRGENDGVTVGMPVVVDEGILIGKVTSVTKENATVTSIAHQDSATAVTILNVNRTIGLIEGGSGNLLIMSYIPNDQQIEVNNLVVTSGLEELIPSGLLVGVVNALNIDQQTPFKEAVVEPLADAKRYSRVLVIQEIQL